MIDPEPFLFRFIGPDNPEMQGLIELARLNRNTFHLSIFFGRMVGKKEGKKTKEVRSSSQ